MNAKKQVKGYVKQFLQLGHVAKKKNDCPFWLSLQSQAIFAEYACVQDQSRFFEGELDYLHNSLRILLTPAA